MPRWRVLEVIGLGIRLRLAAAIFLGRLEPRPLPHLRRTVVFLVILFAVARLRRDVDCERRLLWAGAARGQLPALCRGGPTEADDLIFVVVALLSRLPSAPATRLLGPSGPLRSPAPKELQELRPQVLHLHGLQRRGERGASTA